MLPKKITYTDFNGEERTETFYFNLTEAEIAHMHLASDAGLDKKIQRIVDADNHEKIVDAFEEIILLSYGERSEDGRLFKKEDSIRGKYVDDFKASGAYNALYMELVTDEKAAAEFINGILPAKIREGNTNQNHPALK